MAKFGDALAKYMKDMQVANEIAIEAVGETGQSILKNEPNIKDRIFDGRLEGSMTWATSKDESGVDNTAPADYHVPKPKKDGIVYIGTGCPYADIYEFGGIAGSFEYGKNGNPTSRKELEQKIAEWVQRRNIVAPTDDNFDNVVQKICNNIESGEQAAYPFFYSAVAKIADRAPRIWAETFLSTMHRKRYNNEEKV